MNIGNIEFKHTAFLAPMAGIADRAFRELCVNYGAAYTVTEMVSSKGLTMGDRKSGALLTIGSERPCGAQIFGDDPKIMAEAAVKCLNYTPEIIDINMGCPAPKVAMNGGGASLLKNPQLAYEITKAVVEAANIPVTAKIRTGWDDENIVAQELAELLEKAGVSAIAIHGRTRKQMYSGKVDYGIIRDVKKAVSVPVIANGDITDEQSAAIMLEKTGCDAVMIGRGALGNPWVFSKINAYLDECRVLPDPTITQKMTVMLKHIEKIIEYKGEYTAMREARHHAGYYTKGMRGGASLRREICTFEHFEQLQELAFKIVKENE